jgi:hypothetical protein
VIDGGYRRKLGDLVLAAADTVVWLDLPLHVWPPRLLARTVHRLRAGEGRRDYASELADHPVVRLRTQAEVDRFAREARP